MKIFCTGLQRTGTNSISEALTALGFKTKHYAKGLRSDPDHEEIDQYDAFSDWPIPMIYKELDERHPGSKFIHTWRDEEAWLKSVEWLFTVGAKKYNWPESGPAIDLHTKFYGTETFDKEKFLAAYQKHNREVREYFEDRPADLLVLKLEEEDNFEKLGNFLNVPVPEMPFPCSNRQESLWRIRWQQAVNWGRSTKHRLMTTGK